MITQSREDTRRLFEELARARRARQREVTLDGLRAVKGYIKNYGWSPQLAPGPKMAGTVGQAVHYGFQPTVEVYCLVRNAVGEYVNGNDEGWLELPDEGMRPDLASDVIAWEEGQSTETVLATVDEMISLARGFDEDYADYQLEE